MTTAGAWQLRAARDALHDSDLGWTDWELVYACEGWEVVELAYLALALCDD